MNTIWWHVYPLGFLGGDDAIRPAFPETPAGLPASGRKVHDLHRRLIALRRRNPWLERARTTVTHLTNTAMRYTVGDGTRSLHVALDLGDPPSCSIDEP